MSSVAVPLRRRPVDIPGRADVLALASLALGYPDAALLAARPDLVKAAAALPPSTTARHLRRFAAWFASLEPRLAQSTYVETFDLRRRSSLYLTYYLHGDTRRRGQALVLVKQRYRAAGFVPDDGELVDYLPTALEFAALAGPGPGEGLLRAHRVGLELIRRSLTDVGSPYADVLDAVCDVVGDLGAAGRQEADTLVGAGPPDELVGVDLDPYAVMPPGTPAAYASGAAPDAPGAPAPAASGVPAPGAQGPDCGCAGARRRQPKEQP